MLWVGPWGMANEHNGSEGGSYNVCFEKCPFAIVSGHNGTHGGVENTSTMMDGGATLYDHNAIGPEPSKWPSSFFLVQMGNARTSIKIMRGLSAQAIYDFLVSADQKVSAWYCPHVWTVWDG